MSEPFETLDSPTPLTEAVAVKRRRRLDARRRPDRTIWFGLGMFGLIGWSVAIPTLVGIAVGLWIDRRWPSPYSWTLMLLLAGVALGCLNAWRWVHRESFWDPSRANRQHEETAPKSPPITDQRTDDQTGIGESLKELSKPVVAAEEEIP